MNNLLLLLVIGVPLTLHAQQPTPPNTYNPSILGEIKPNEYGPGINGDVAGRLFEWKTGSQPRQKVFGPVEPNGYGMGVGKDQYGRPVKAKPWP